MKTVNILIVSLFAMAFITSGCSKSTVAEDPVGALDLTSSCDASEALVGGVCVDVSSECGPGEGMNADGACIALGEPGETLVCADGEELDPILQACVQVDNTCQSGEVENTNGDCSKVYVFNRWFTHNKWVLGSPEAKRTHVYDNYLYSEERVADQIANALTVTEENTLKFGKLLIEGYYSKQADVVTMFSQQQPGTVAMVRTSFTQKDASGKYVYLNNAFDVKGGVFDAASDWKTGETVGYIYPANAANLPPNVKAVYMCIVIDGGNAQYPGARIDALTTTDRLAAERMGYGCTTSTGADNILGYAPSL